MASTYRLDSHKYDGRYMYLTCTQTKDIATNTSSVAWTLTVTGGSYNYYATGPTTIKINGETIYYKAKTTADSHAFPAAKGSTSGVTTIAHDVNGNATVEVSIKTNIYTGVLKTTTGSWTLDSIPRFATITSAPDFNDEQKPTITYSNPAGDNVSSLQACITLDGSDPNVDASVAVAYRNIPTTGTTYTFDDITADELYNIQYATKNGNARKVYFKIKTIIGSTVGYSQVEKTFTIANPNPVINPTITDTDSAIIAITGNNKTLVRYQSNVSISINAVAVKAATLDTSSVTCGGKSPVNGVIEDIPSGSFVFYAKDSRGNETTKTIDSSSGLFSFINYLKPTCVITKNMPDTDGKMTVQATGSYYNGSFGKQHNALNVYYRYKPAGQSFTNSDNWTLMDVSVNGNSYSATAVISDLDYKTAYTFQTYARDILNSTESEPSETTVKATPVFDWGENDFKFNVPVYDEFNTIIRNGKAAYTGTGTNAIDPNSTVEELCLTDHANCPKPGYWFFIRTMLYGDLSTTAYRSQIAYPSGATMSVYHRFYSSDSGWSAWRRHLNEDESYIQMKELWRNASTTSAFANQTLSLDLTNYDLVHVEFLTNCSTGAWQSYRITTTVPVNHETAWKNYKAVGFGSNGTDIAFRAFHMGNNTIRFGESYYASSYATSSLTTNNNLYIPLRIYGIKGVS